VAERGTLAVDGHGSAPIFGTRVVLLTLFVCHSPTSALLVDMVLRLLSIGSEPIFSVYGACLSSSRLLLSEPEHTLPSAEAGQ
jgi:hypothetical protein